MHLISEEEAKKMPFDELQKYIEEVEKEFGHLVDIMTDKG